MVNLFFAILWLWERLWNLSGNLQVRSLEGSVQFGYHPVIIFAARVVGGRLVIVPVGYRADAGRHQGSLPQTNASVSLADHLLLNQGRVKILGIAVATEAEIAQGVENHPIAVFLHRLQNMRMRTPHNIRTGIDAAWPTSICSWVGR